jgi:hypothetical protein
MSQTRSGILNRQRQRGISAQGFEVSAERNLRRASLPALVCDAERGQDKSEKESDKETEHRYASPWLSIWSIHHAQDV